MKIHSPSHNIEEARTLWPIELGDFDPSPGASDLWTSGFYRSGSTPDLIALWMAAVLGRFAVNKMEFPDAISPELRTALRPLIGRDIELGPIVEKARPAHSAEGTAVLIRDELDFVLAETLLDDDVIKIGVFSDASAVGRISTNFPIFTNAIFVARRSYDLDSTGSIATLSAFAPHYGVGKLVSFQCSDEWGLIDKAAFCDAARVAGVTIELPFKDQTINGWLSELRTISYPESLINRLVRRRFWSNSAVLERWHRSSV